MQSNIILEQKSIEQLSIRHIMISEYTKDEGKFKHGMLYTKEPQHDKTNKITYIPSKDSHQPRKLLSMIFTGCHLGNVGPKTDQTKFEYSLDNTYLLASFVLLWPILSQTCFVRV